MIIFSCNPNLRNYEYGVCLDGATFNPFSLPLIYSIRITDNPVRFDNSRTIGIKYRKNDYHKYLKEVIEFAAREGISAIAVPCPNSLSLKDVSSLNESLVDTDDEINVRIILNRKYLEQINSENDRRISEYIKKNFHKSQTIQF